MTSAPGSKAVAGSGELEGTALCGCPQCHSSSKQLLSGQSPCRARPALPRRSVLPTYHCPAAQEVDPGEGTWCAVPRALIASPATQEGLAR